MSIARKPLCLAVFAALATTSLPVLAADVTRTATVVAAAAQAAPQDVEDEAGGDEAEGERRLETIVVTGSRIRRAGFDTLEPAIVVDADYVRNRGLTNVADALNEIPGFGTGTTPEGGQAGFGVAVNFVNRFGLGSNRTLTLINGRRVVSSNPATIFGPAGPGSQVDLNIVPAQLIDRIENVAIGGAPTYGSDAIAGVVNVILQEDYEGLTASGVYGVTDRGDGERVNTSWLFGKNFGEGRGNITASAWYDYIDGVLQTERERFASSLSFQPNPLTSVLATQPGRSPGSDGRINTGIGFNTGNTDGIPNAVLIRDNRFFTFTGGGLLFPATGAFNLPDGRLRGFGPNQTTYLAFDRSGNLVPYNPGINFGTSNASGGDGFNLVETAQITSGLDRQGVSSSGRYDITDRSSLFFEAQYYNAEADEIIDQPIYNVNLFPGLSAPITIPTSYAGLSEQARAQLNALGVTSFRLSRASRDLVNNNASGETDLYRVVAGWRGDFDAADRLFNWEVSYNYGKNESNFFATVLDQQRFINAVNVVRDASGRLVCSPTPVAGLVIPGGGTPVADPACVPIDLFGEGRTTTAGRNYVTGITNTDSQLELAVLNANIGGDVMQLWGGPWSFNLGYEARTEEGQFTPDAFQQAGRGRAVPILPNGGKFETDEYFFETVVPLVDAGWDLPLLNKFDLTGKFRRVDNTVNGEFDTYTYGFQYRPIADLEFRGNRTQSLRAPAIIELFTPVSNIFTTVPDPCDFRNITGGTAPATRAANCAAFFRTFNIANPNTFQSIAVSATVPGTLGGDPNLQNEEAKSESVGVVWQPEDLIPGLRVAVDYYRIEIDNVIANLNATAIATGCFDNPNFNAADAANANSFCSRIVRRADGQIDTIRTGFVNGGFLDFRGNSADVQYRTDLTDIGLVGDLTLNATLFRLRELKNSVNNVTTTDLTGTIGNSKRQYQYGVQYSLDPVGVGLQANYISGALFSNTNTVETQDILGVESQWSFNADVVYRISDNGIVRLAVTNLTDREPPFPLAGGGIAVYDILGRRYALSAEWSW
jgi:outer membrane receptor protein involved in Fe transport